MDQAGSSCSDKHMDSVDVTVDVNVLSNRIKAVLESKRERRLRVAICVAIWSVVKRGVSK